jgi:UDP-glucuronate 4-epimerase
VAATYADTTALQAWTGFAPSTSIEQGIGRFVAWYRDFYRA